MVVDISLNTMTEMWCTIPMELNLLKYVTVLKFNNRKNGTTRKSLTEYCSFHTSVNEVGRSFGSCPSELHIAGEE